MRGAIAVALVYYYFDPKGMAADSHRSTIIATTLIVVLFSTVVFSAATKPLLEFMLGAGMPACSSLPVQHCLSGCSFCRAGSRGGVGAEGVVRSTNDIVGHSTHRQSVSDFLP